MSAAPTSDNEKKKQKRGRFKFRLAYGRRSKKPLSIWKTKVTNVVSGQLPGALKQVDNHPERITMQVVENTIKNWNGIMLPTPVSESVYKKFEKNNNVSLLVFGLTGTTVFRHIFLPFVIKNY